MPRYRMYSLDQHGRIGLSQEVDASCDQDAIRLFREMKPDARQGELWEGRRLVATLEKSELVTDPA